MNLIEIKDDSQIKSTLAPLDVSIERKSGKISRLVIGPVSSPMAVIEKDGTYSEHIAVQMVERKTTFKSSVDFLGAKLENEFDSESARDKWEAEVLEQHLGMTLEFSHSTKIVVA